MRNSYRETLAGISLFHKLDEIPQNDDIIDTVRNTMTSVEFVVKYDHVAIFDPKRICFRYNTVRFTLVNIVINTENLGVVRARKILMA